MAAASSCATPPDFTNTEGNATDDRPSRLAFTWIAAPTDMQPTLVTLAFVRAKQLETDPILTHERFSRKEVPDQYQGGWSQIGARLDAYLQAQRRM